MPAGRIHDQITLRCLPFVAGLTLLISRSANLTLIVCGGFLFSGLMFGPDLDIHSCQFNRWGLLKWIWLPYQKSLRHRSFLSHGPVVGTMLRLVYLGTWMILLVGLGLGIAYSFGGVIWSWQEIVAMVKTSFKKHAVEWLVLYGGLELGALSHSLSDWAGSVYKTYFRLVIPPTVKQPSKAHGRRRS
jgi:uncharacterized metal-binding protein